MYRLLVADDEMIERAVLVQLLEEELGDQCRIFQAENGREALEVYEKEKIQIAVLDIEMPGITGIEAAQRIREKDKDCCIIFLTAFDEFSYAKKAITIRALDYLLKPYDEKELLLVLDEAMRMVDEYQTEEIRKTVTETTAGSPEGEGSGSGAAVVNGTGGDPMMERMEKDTASSGDQDVPFRESKQMARKIPRSQFFPVYYLEHDFDRDTTKPEGMQAYRAALAWLKDVKGTH